MVRFVHITAESNAGSIRRSGLRPKRYKGGFRGLGVYAMPVLPSHELTYQWAREIKRLAQARSMIGVSFRIPDDEPVLVGRYNAPRRERTAAQAIGLIHEQTDPRGWEVIVPRAVPVANIVAVKRLPRIVGWRYWPEAHGVAPCTCAACIGRGAPYQGKLRAAALEAEREMERRWAAERSASDA